MLDLLRYAFIPPRAYVSIFYSVSLPHHSCIGGLDCRGERRITRKTNTFEVLTRCPATTSPHPGVRHETVKTFDRCRLVFTRRSGTSCSIRYVLTGVGGGKGRDARGRCRWSWIVHRSRTANVILVTSSLRGSGRGCPLLRASNDIYAPSKLARFSLGMGAD